MATLDAGINPQYALDDDSIFVSGQTVTTSAVGTVGGSAAFYDFGADWNQLGARTFIFDLGAIDNTTTDETYQLQLEYAAATNFGTVLGECIRNIAATDANKQIVFIMAPLARYVRCNTVTGGTTPSIVINTAWIV